MRRLLPFVVAVLAGCGGTTAVPVPPAAVAEDAETAKAVAEERAKLSPADRAAVDAQEWCVVSQTERLGSMGPPLKLDIPNETIFVCCGGCRRKAEADPAKTIAERDKLVEKAKAQKGK